MMWLRTIMNYQYRYGLTARQAARALWLQVHRNSCIFKYTYTHTPWSSSDAIGWTLGSLALLCYSFWSCDIEKENYWSVVSLTMYLGTGWLVSILSRRFLRAPARPSRAVWRDSCERSDAFSGGWSAAGHVATLDGSGECRGECRRWHLAVVHHASRHVQNHSSGNFEWNLFLCILASPLSGMYWALTHTVNGEFCDAYILHLIIRWMVH